MGRMGRSRDIKSHTRRWATHKLENNYSAEVLPHEWEFWVPRWVPHPGDPAPGRLAPRPFGSEGQQGLISGVPKDSGKYRLHSWMTHTRSYQHWGSGQKLSFGRRLGQTYLLALERLGVAAAGNSYIWELSQSYKPVLIFAPPSSSLEPVALPNSL